MPKLCLTTAQLHDGTSITNTMGEQELFIKMLHDMVSWRKTKKNPAEIVCDAFFESQ